MHWRKGLLIALWLGGPTLQAQTPKPGDLKKPSAVFGAPVAPAPFKVRGHYSKYEYRIPMRDGVKLFTAVYSPTDGHGPYPFLIHRTCYSVEPYGPDKYPDTLGPSGAFGPSGYIFVYQDVRGCQRSEGDWQEMTPEYDTPTGTGHDESTDAYDTVEWLLKNVPDNNGKAGIYGVSYPGFYAAAALVNGHPALVAASPQAPVTDMYDNDDEYHNGALMLEANVFYREFRPRGKPMWGPQAQPHKPYAIADAYQAFQSLEPLSKALSFIDNPLLNELVSHPSYDAYWQARDLSRHLHDVHAAVLVVGGWFDAEDLSGPWKTFAAIDRNNPKVDNHIVVGPWTHGQWWYEDGEYIEPIHFGSKTAEFFRREVQFPFFEHYLKGAPLPDLAKVTVFETGTNAWRRYPSWPPPGATARTLYLGAHGTLGFDPPPADTGEDRGFDEYVSDPRHPVPETGYQAEPGPPIEYMVADQRFAAQRPDVLVYQTEPLAEDLTLAGPVQAHLRVSTSGTDSDFIVKLIDVWPQDAGYDQMQTAAPQSYDMGKRQTLLGGYEQLVRGEPARGKYRESLTEPKPFKPWEETPVDFSLVQVNHTFRKRHRIMVQVQSSWFPLVDLNPQRFENIPEARESDFQSATERIFHTAAAASGLEVTILPATTAK